MIAIGPIRRETLFLLSIVIALSAVIIWIRTATVKSTYQYVQQEKELAKIEQELSMARVRWLKMTSSTKLEALASEHKLSPPKLGQRFRVALNPKN